MRLVPISAGNAEFCCAVLHRGLDRSAHLVVSSSKTTKELNTRKCFAKSIDNTYGLNGCGYNRRSLAHNMFHAIDRTLQPRKASDTGISHRSILMCSQSSMPACHCFHQGGSVINALALSTDTMHAIVPCYRVAATKQKGAEYMKTRTSIVFARRSNRKNPMSAISVPKTPCSGGMLCDHSTWLLRLDTV